MLRLGLGVVTMGLFAASQGACGGGSAKADASGGDADGTIGRDGPVVVDGQPVFDGAQTGGFITGDVDGVTKRVEVNLRAGTVGLGPGEIWLTAGASAADAWNVYIPNSVGTSSCPPDWVARFEPDGAVLRSDEVGGTCAVTVTRAAPAVGDVIEGTFTATLKTELPSDPRTAAVTNGAFHVTRNFQ